MIPAAEWMDRAACHGRGELFFLPRTDPHTSLAQAICAECPVQNQCRDFALSAGITDGIWGGLTEDDRAAVHRANREQGVTS